MTDIVVDASAALAWLLRSQATEASDQFIKDSGDRSFIAPFVFEWEVRNVLLDFVHRGRLQDTDYGRSIDELEAYRVTTGPVFPAADVEPLAKQARLSLFDAAYLSLATSRRLGLASRDGDLLKAAKALGVQTWDLR